MKVTGYKENKTAMVNISSQMASIMKVTGYKENKTVRERGFTKIMKSTLDSGLMEKDMVLGL